jgi:hypothetical protein
MVARRDIHDGKPSMRKHCAPVHDDLNYSERVIKWVFAAQVDMYK